MMTHRFATKIDAVEIGEAFRYCQLCYARNLKINVSKSEWKLKKHRRCAHNGCWQIVESSTLRLKKGDARNGYY